MKIFGLEFRRAKSMLSAVDPSRGWWPIVRESYAGAWQKGHTQPIDGVLANSTVYRCVTLIAADVAKMRLRLMERNSNGIWIEKDVAAFSPLLRKPNDYQNRIQFFEHWLISKLSAGNTYILKGRDNRNVVSSLYVLDPRRTKPLVSPDGSVFYELRRDDLSGLYGETVTVPASEIIHDRMNALFHPLCGLSPIYASGLAAGQALRIQEFSDKFFANAARPSGVLTAPGLINKETAARLKEHWESNYTAANAGRVAVLGDGLKFESMTQDAVDSQLIEQLRWTAENVCSAFGIPAYKVGVGATPAYNNIEALDQQYYDDCLQIHIESIELLLDEGIELPSNYGVEFDLDDLLRMDTATMVKSIADAVGAGVMAPNEGRKKLGYVPVEGGDTPYLQQQNFSLAALNKRDQGEDPFAWASPRQAPPPPANNNNNIIDPAQAASALAEFRKVFANV